MELKDLKHGMKVTCTIGRLFSSYEITDGKIAIEGKRYLICQDKVQGYSISDKLGYKYSWALTSGEGGNVNMKVLESIKPASLFDTLKVGDVIEDEDGDTRKIIDVLPNSCLTSCLNNHEMALGWDSREEINRGYTKVEPKLHVKLMIDGKEVELSEEGADSIREIAK
jgi:hypothetical protein